MKTYLKALVRQALGWWRPRTLVLCYHHVCEPGATAPWITVSPGRFAEQMAFLGRERLVAPLDELRHDLRRRRLARRPRVVVTFDDASLDLFNIAYPILARHGVPATVFIPTGLMGSPKPFWWNRLYLLGRQAEQGGRDLWAFVHCAGALLPPNTPADAVWHTLRFLDNARREEVLARCGELLGPVPDGAGSLPMTWDQLRELERTGLFTFGAHTVTHPPLAALPADQVTAEVVGSRDELVKFPSFRKVFAYPYGDARVINTKVRRAIKEAGFESSFTTRARAVTGPEDPLALGRVCMDEMTPAEFRWLVDRFLCR